MRVSEVSKFASFVQRFESINSDIARALETLADGKRVRQASDDPTGARNSMYLRARVTGIDGFRRSSETARTDLQTIETALGQAHELLIQAQEAAVAGKSTTNEGGLGALADEVDSVRDSILALANTRQSGRYLFSGTEVTSEPFDGLGAYSGNDDEVRALIDTSRSVGATVSGQRVFADGGDILATLDSLATALRTNDQAALSSLLDPLDAQLGHVRDVRSEVGVRLQQIEESIAAQSDERVRLLGRISQIEDASIERTALELNAANASYEALAGTAARVLGRSFFDFLG